jgi:uncharacterized repeat protein (TIGR01451 family)
MLRVNVKNDFRFARQIIILFFLILFLNAASYALPAPSQLNARAAPEKGSVVLSWSAVGGADGYNIYRKETADVAYQRMNFAPVKTLSYEDKAVRSGRDYLYMVRSLDSMRTESGDSQSVGAPLMSIKTSATITTLRDKPVEAKSIRTGEMVTFASPGDIINYHVSYANHGYSSARNVTVNYDIPDGTVIAGTPRIMNGAVVTTAYYDRVKGTWLSSIEQEKNVTRVRFKIAGDVPPVGKDKVNGTIILNVVIVI